MITVSGIHFYPVKSCAGTALQAADADGRGIINDRGWMVVGEGDQFLTQRQLPRMSLISPSITPDNALRLQAPDMQAAVIPIVRGGPVLKLQVWSDACEGIDQGAEAAEWLSSFLNLKCRLVKMSDDHQRRVDSRYAPRKEDQVGFADGFPFLIISSASLADLNSRLAVPLPMDRFRPNIVVDGCEPFAEDGWKEIRIGDMHFDVVKPCARCVITTVDQATAEIGKEPMKTLAAYRNIRGKVMFGQNMIHQQPGRIRVGDHVTVLN